MYGYHKWFNEKNYIMKRLLLIIFCIFITNVAAYSQMVQGGVSSSYELEYPMNTVIDKSTNQPIANAKVSIPSKNFVTYTDINGHFRLKAKIDNKTILSVEKPNYKPFSLTVNKNSEYNTFVLRIERSNIADIRLQSGLCHLGDNNYSNLSANACQFKQNAAGPVFKTNFYISDKQSGRQNYLIIGSIIGIDTALAKGLGQNNITNAFATPPSVYLNGVKITEIKVNGDNQKIKLPHNLIKWNKNNEIVIKSGVNLMQTAYVDYDDIEFMNLHISDN